MKPIDVLKLYMRTKPNLYRRGNTWYCQWGHRYSFADTPAVAYANFIYTHVKR